MSTTRRPALALLGALVCAVLVWPAGAVLAAPHGSTGALLAQERYLSTFGTSDPASGPAPEERYLSSYGEPEPLAAPPQEPGGMAWPVVALGAAGLAGVAAAGGTGLRRRHLQRRRDPEERPAQLVGG